MPRACCRAASKTGKDVSPEQAERIAAHPKVKATGVRKVIGITAEGVFAKIPAEISYMDANCTKWSYATPTTGRMPESGKEVAMDTAALQLLGVTPELGAEVTVSYSITDKDQTAFTVTDTFTLVGYWDYDELMPVHYINISRDYTDGCFAFLLVAYRRNCPHRRTAPGCCRSQNPCGPPLHRWPGLPWDWCSAR